MDAPALRPIAAFLAVTLALGACTNATDPDAGAAADADRAARDDAPTSVDREQGSGGTTSTDGSTMPVSDLDPELQTLVANVALGYQQAEGAWAGFVPNDHPTVIVTKDEADTVIGAVAFNHPEADQLGTATAIDLGGLPFRSLHLVTDPTDQEAMERLEGFDFHAQLGGVDCFAMVASATDDFFDPTTKDYVSTLLHEMFHRYQDESFQQMGGQDIEGYAYTAQNLQLAILEERALADAITATDETARAQAASRFAAIRQARLAADPRVELDNSQEMFEGTARYLEHRLGGQGDSGFLMDETNHDRDLITSFDQANGIKETFGFGRWYASGAAVLRLLDLLEVGDVAGRVEAGESPAEILAAALDVDEANRDRLVTEAVERYDPDGELAARAAAAAEQATTEPPVFGDDGAAADPGDGDAAGGGQPLTDEELACLTENGVDLEADEVAITDAQREACIG